MIDIHNHMLPGLDDGPKDWEESLAMARMAVEDGIREVVCTPHWQSGVYANTRSVIQERLESFQKKLGEHEIPLEVHPGSELHIDVALLEKINKGELCTLNDSGHYAMIELPKEILPQKMEDFFWSFLNEKITPVLAHTEKYLFLLQEPSILYDWIRMGILTQITASSLVGRYGPEWERFALKLLEHGMVHMIATDAHGRKIRRPKMDSARKVAEQVLGKDMALELVRGTPKRILKGEPVIPVEPVPFRSPSFLTRARSALSF